MDDNTYCITGATGFIGTHLLKKLEQYPDISIRLLVRESQLYNIKNPKVKLIYGDLSTASSLESFLVPGAVVINLAFSKQLSTEQNTQAAELLMELCKEKKIKHFLHVSTVVVAGSTPAVIVTEDTPCSPITSYETAKYSIEAIVEKSAGKELPVTILRPSAVLGMSGEALLHIIRQLTKESTLKQRLKATIYARRKMNLVHIDNLIAAILFILNKPLPDCIDKFIISDDEYEGNNYDNVMRIVCEELNIPPIKPLPCGFLSKLLPFLLKIRKRSNSNPLRIYSSEKIIQAGLKKSIDFDQGVRGYVREAMIIMSQSK